MPNTPRTNKLPLPTSSEAAFERVLAEYETTVPSGAVVSPLRSWIDSAFANAATYAQDRYASIGDASAFNTKVAGVSFNDRQHILAGIVPGSALSLVREPENAFDANAIAVKFGALQLGYVKKDIAKHIAPHIDNGASYRAVVKHITGGGDRGHYGLNVYIERMSDGFDAPLLENIQGSRDADPQTIREALIGDHRPHDAQRQALSRIDHGANTLLLMGTGRGKSFCFSYPAVVRALGSSQKTIVVYPLRALANDQFEALHRRLEPLGVRVLRANGSITPDEREHLTAALQSGAWDIVLATPEFLTYHCDAFSGVSKPSFLVVDEAHHLFESRHRKAYQSLGQTIARLGKPQILALSATLHDDAFAHLVSTLGITAWVIDPTMRENLDVIDARGTRDKIEYLKRLGDGDEKCIVYVNSRKEAGKIAEELRARLGDIAMFYHAGMPSALRAEVEGHFRRGDVRIIIATSAFGEGIDLPDVRHVVHYHLNFDLTEFNQQSGRAGRDGAPAFVHLLYGDRDRGINEFILDRENPRLETLRLIYRGLRALARNDRIVGSEDDLVRELQLKAVDAATIRAALRIFVDEKLLAIEEDDEGRSLVLLPVVEKIDLERNERFAEGEAIREAFGQFCELALRADGPTLRRIIDRPIYPQHIAHLR